MGRFFFNLEGQRNVRDPAGSSFESEVDAFRAAMRLAIDVCEAQPILHGNTCVVVTRRGSDDTYYVGV